MLNETNQARKLIALRCGNHKLLIKAARHSVDAFNRHARNILFTESMIHDLEIDLDRVDYDALFSEYNLTKI